MSSNSAIPRVYDAGVNHESSILTALEPGPLHLLPCEAAAPPEASGAEARFIGRTRPDHHPDHGALIALEYEAHPTLAAGMLQEIARELQETFALTAITLRHAVGRVGIGEASVEVLVRADHRREAFAACQAGIDRIKAGVPIWKREHWSDGTTWSDSSESTLHQEHSS